MWCPECLSGELAQDSSTSKQTELGFVHRIIEAAGGIKPLKRERIEQTYTKSAKQEEMDPEACIC